ncbi:MAG: CPBP family intramembrane metalloprotease [Acidobacteria bacterium]|nr:MAG: CPBP family intramembrane metalloprotease [Acidobacteriota bacterium]
MPRHALEAFGVSLVLVFLCSVLAAPLVADYGLAARIPAVQLGLAGAAFYVLRRHRLPLAAAVPRIGLGPRVLLASLLLGLGALLVSGATSARLYDFRGGHARQLSEQTELLVAQVGAVAAVALYGLLVPLSEELLFRGVVLRGLLGRWPPAAAIAVSTLAFAVYHVHPVHILIAFLLGLVCAYAVIRSGSFWAGAAVHASNNSAALIAALTLGGDRAAGPLAPGWGALGLLFLLFGARLLPYGGSGSSGPPGPPGGSTTSPKAVRSARPQISPGGL